MGSTERAWAKLIKSVAEPEQKQPEQKQPQRSGNLEKRVILPNRLTPRTLQVVFSSIFSGIPLEKLDDEIERFIVEDRTLVVRFKECNK